MKEIAFIKLLRKTGGFPIEGDWNKGSKESQQKKTEKILKERMKEDLSQLATEQTSL